MKLKLPSPVSVLGPAGEMLEVSAAQVVEHVARTHRDLGASIDVENVRKGSRILAALSAGSSEQTADISADDVEALKKALAKPSRGWVMIAVEVKLEPPPGQDAKVVRRQFMPQSIDLLPIVDALLSA